MGIGWNLDESDRIIYALAAVPMLGEFTILFFEDDMCLARLHNTCRLQVPGSHQSFHTMHYLFLQKGERAVLEDASHGHVQSLSGETTLAQVSMNTEVPDAGEDISEDTMANAHVG